MPIVESGEEKNYNVEIVQTKPYTVEINSSKPRSTAVISDIRTGVVEIRDPGIAGPPGLPGAAGEPGTPGSSLITGNGAPTSGVGNNGDLYLDVISGNYYGPKASGLWPTSPIISISQTKRYVHNQPVTASTWNITHSLGGRPSVTIVDSAGTTVIGEVVYNSDTSITVLFSAPFSGQAYLT